MPGNSTPFLLSPGVSTFYFFNPPRNSMSSTPPPQLPLFFFFCNSPLEIVTASQTEICTLLIQQSTCFGQQDNEPKPYCLNFHSGFMSALTALQ